MDRIFIFFQDRGVGSYVDSGKANAQIGIKRLAHLGDHLIDETLPFFADFLDFGTSIPLPHFQDDRQCQGIAVDTTSGDDFMSFAPEYRSWQIPAPLQIASACHRLAAAASSL